MQALVIARAHRGEPLKLAAISEGERVVYLSAIDKLEAVGNGQSEPIGFPKEDVFVFESDTYDRLRSAWELGTTLPADSWHNLHRYGA